MTFTVVATIQSTLPPTENHPFAEPVEVQWYKGENLPAALAALVQSAVRYDEDPGYVKTLGVRLDIS